MYENVNLTIPSDEIARNLVSGIRLILKYQEDARVYADRGTISFGSTNKYMSPKGKELLANWGWYEGEGVWSIDI